MARKARVVIPGIPHHVTQRGNRRQRTFFRSRDYQTYKKILSQYCEMGSVEVWSYCLMPNHIHVIAVPHTETSLALVFGKTHEAYTRYINWREGWRGYLWQGRFGSYAMDEEHLFHAVQYVEMNPVMAKIVNRPEDYLWSSARAHVKGDVDILVRKKHVLNSWPDWPELLQQKLEVEKLKKIETHLMNWRPLGSEQFIKQLEVKTGRRLRPMKRGPKPKCEKKQSTQSSLL